MSRKLTSTSSLVSAASLAAVALLAIPSAAQAQEAAQPDTAPNSGPNSGPGTEKPGSVAETFDNARKAYGPDEPKPLCPEQIGDEIVVCAQIIDPDKYRLRSKKDAENDYARRTMFAGDPQAPNVSGPGIFTGPATASGCLAIPGVQKCPPPPAIIVDFSALPEAPPGSDADRIGRGLAPRGNELGNTPITPPTTTPALPNSPQPDQTETVDEAGQPNASPPPNAPAPGG